MLTKEVLPPRQSLPCDLRDLRASSDLRGARGEARWLLAGVVLVVIAQLAARLLEMWS